MALDLQSLSITSVFNSIVSFFRSQENNSKWRDFSTGSEGSFLIRMLANVFSALSYRIVAQSRENYLSTAALTSSNVGIAVNLGYSVFRGSNLKRRISFLPNVNHVFPKMSVIGTYNDSYDIITLNETTLEEGVPVEFDVVVGKLKEETLTTGTSAVKFFHMFTTGISEDFVLYLDSQEVPTTKNMKEMIEDKYLVRTNPYGSVDIAYLNNYTGFKYTYGTGSELTVRYVELAQVDEVPFTDSMFSYGTLQDVRTLSSYIPFESIDEIKVKAPLDHETQNLIRSKADYASRLRIEIPNLISTNWKALTPTFTQISYLKSDSSLLTESEKDSFIELMEEERYFGTPLPDIVHPRREVADLAVSLELTNKYKNISDVDMDVSNIIENSYNRELGVTFNVYDLERKIENLPYVRYARVGYKINDREANKSYQLGYILEKDGTYYMASKILGLSGMEEPAWNFPAATPRDIDTGIEQIDGSLIWRIYRRLPNVPEARLWTANYRYAVGEWVYPSGNDKYMMKCVDLVKQSGGSAPTITYAEKGDFIVDGGIVWVVRDYAEGSEIQQWAATTNYRLGDRVNIVTSSGNYTLQCVSYTGTVSSSSNIVFEKESYSLLVSETTQSSFTLEGNQTSFFMKGDSIKAISSVVTTTFTISAVNYNSSTDRTIINVTPNINLGNGYTTLETETGGTRDGQILWSLIDDIEDVEYDWNAYVTFTHELTIIGE